jgi:transposase
MSSITRQRIGKYIYLYESTSYWDKEKGPRNKKISIGHIDPKTGEPVYKLEYLARQASSSADNSQCVKFDGSDFQCHELMEALDSIKDYGVSYFLLEIATKLGLFNTMKQSLLRCWKEILALACYLVACDKAVMYCEDWISCNDGFDANGMSSQRVSDLLMSITCQERHSFYQSWYKLIREQEYIALDITSVSSYSKQITGCEWGYNRDHEDLPQVNICMLFGETSKLPVFQTMYSGSLKDVSTLNATIAEFTGITGGGEYRFVMDKGFFSAKNVNMLLHRHDCKFLIPVSFTSKFAVAQIDSEAKDIDQINNVIHTSGAPIRGVCKIRAWGSGGKKLYTHVYYDPEKALSARNELYEKVSRLQELALRDPSNKEAASAMRKFLIVRKSTKTTNGLTVNIRDDVVEQVPKTADWLVLISNHISDPQEALDIYRIKDVVEKGFWKYKNSLGLDRLRVHNDERVQNKIFISFIALVLASHVHNVMDKKQLYKRWTFERLMIVLAKLKVFTVSGNRILRPLTKEQKDIFDAFGLVQPNIS